jgi:hypothetical protein
LLALKTGGRFAVVKFVFELALLEAAFAVASELEFCAETKMLIDSIMSINSVNFFIFSSEIYAYKKPISNDCWDDAGILLAYILLSREKTKSLFHFLKQAFT